MDAHPQTYCGDLANLPAALSPLCLRDQWVIWKWQLAENGKWTKPPYCADSPNRFAANNNPQTWATYHSAVTAFLAGCADGVGFALTNTNVGAIDLDHCRNPETGAIDAWSQAILDRVPTAYREITVSGEGLRIIGVAKGRSVHRKFNIAGSKGAAVEVYRRAVRYITISGLQIGECAELPNIDTVVDDIVAQHSGGNGHDVDAKGFDFEIDELIRTVLPRDSAAKPLLVLCGRWRDRDTH
jgi:primase-polymerase (primpol)-like protein